MNKKPLVALSVIGLIALGLSTGSAVAQDPTPTAGPQPSPVIPEVLVPQSPQQPDAPSVPTGTQLGTTLSYQGQLQKSGGAYNGNCNFQFSLWDAATGGAQVGSTVTKNGVTVVNGLFSVELDFGNHFTGEARWLQTSVQCTGDGSPTVLSPRQPQNAVPYALSVRPGATVINAAGYAIDGRSVDSVGVHGSSRNFYGTVGYSVNYPGGFFVSENDTAIHAVTNSTNRAGIYASSPSSAGYGVVGDNLAGGTGVRGNTVNGTGVYGQASGSGNGVFGGAEIGVGGYFYSRNNHGVYAESTNGYAVYAAGRLRSAVVEIAGGSDLAERFSQADGAVAEPGTVMVIDSDHPGQIKPSAGAYDRKVAGIVSGAGDIRPGLTLHQEGVAEGDTVMAIAGRVYVKAEALSGPIEPGDLLTTSDLPGYAMKASDDARSHGAVLGKAMTGLESGTGLVLVIVNLQ